MFYVEDDCIYLILMEEVFWFLLDCELCVVEIGVEVLVVLVECCFDFVLVDMNLFDMMGLELLRCVCEDVVLVLVLWEMCWVVLLVDDLGDVVWVVCEVGFDDYWFKFIDVL